RRVRGEGGGGGFSGRAAHRRGDTPQQIPPFHCCAPWVTLPRYGRITYPRYVTKRRYGEWLWRSVRSAAIRVSWGRATWRLAFAGGATRRGPRCRPAVLLPRAPSRLMARR